MTVAHYSAKENVAHIWITLAAMHNLMYCTNGISMIALYRFAEKLSPKVRGNLNFPHNQPNEKMCVQSRFPLKKLSIVLHCLFVVVVHCIGYASF